MQCFTFIFVEMKRGNFFTIKKKKDWCIEKSELTNFYFGTIFSQGFIYKQFDSCETINYFQPKSGV